MKSRQSSPILTTIPRRRDPGGQGGNRFLFDKLAKTSGQEERALISNDYMSVKFQLRHWQDQTDTARRSIKNSYLRYLHGWMMDSNSVEGAVLKRWVESRMGILVSFTSDEERAWEFGSTVWAAQVPLRGPQQAVSKSLPIVWVACKNSARQIGGSPPPATPLISLGSWVLRSIF